MNRVSIKVVPIAFFIVAMALPALSQAQTGKIDSKQICIRMREASYADVDFAGAVAAHASVIVGCLISEVSRHDPGTMRADAASALVQAIATAHPPLDPQTAQHARETVLKALRDRSVDVRVATVTALAEFGDESMIPALQAVAKSDPVLSLRDYTALAITRLCKHLAGRSGA
jgi:putative Ca2+/H+ antiporter (TMEM165/GDT1 family)